MDQGQIVNSLRRDVQELKEAFEEIKRELKYVRGGPIIQGYTGKRLDLNENINAVLWSKRIKTLEEKVEALS